MPSVKTKQVDCGCGTGDRCVQSYTQVKVVDDRGMPITIPDDIRDLYNQYRSDSQPTNWDWLPWKWTKAEEVGPGRAVKG